MKHFRTTLVFSTVMLMVGCSSLDSSSSFDDVAKSVKERHNYVQVITKDITPDAKAITGADIVKSNLYYVGNFPKTAETKVSESYIDMNVTYFKNYDQFDSVTLGDKQYTLNNYRPLAETCTEHCTVTQWFQFPLNSVYLSQLDSDNVEFSLSLKPTKTKFNSGYRKPILTLPSRKHSLYSIISSQLSRLLRSSMRHQPASLRKWCNIGLTKAPPRIRSSLLIGHSVTALKLNRR